MWITYRFLNCIYFYDVLHILFIWTKFCVHGCIMYICVYLILCQVKHQYKFVSEWLLYHFLSLFFFPIFLFRAAWEKGVIKAEAQNVARNLADTPANLMTPTIFAQVSFMATYSYIGVLFNTILQVRQVCLCMYMLYFLSYNVLLPIMPPTPKFGQEMYNYIFFTAYWPSPVVVPCSVLFLRRNCSFHVCPSDCTNC